MKKLLFWTLMAILAVLVGYQAAQAADVTLRWDASAGATSYKVYQSLDNGLTWSIGVDVGNVVQTTITGVPETGLVMFLVSAIKGGVESLPVWRGAWYDYRKLPPGFPAALGVQ